MAEEDQSFLTSLKSDDDEAQERLQELFDRLRARFVEILDVHGWPGKTLVGNDGAEAAWTLAMHTMPEPPVLRRCLELIRIAASVGEVDASRVAFLVDRAALVDRGVQVYGTVICRLDGGGFGPPSLEDPGGVDDRRRSVGLPPLDEDIRRIEGISAAGSDA
jgi:hypothetical protein